MSLAASFEPPSNCAWHYRSAAGLRGIIESNSLRATSAAFMNDANEMKTGVRALQVKYDLMKSDLSPEDRDIAESGSLLRESSVDNSYLVSASKNPDLLTLWRYYGGDQVAYAIGFDRETVLAPRAHNDAATHPSPPPGYEEDSLDLDDKGNTIRLYDPETPWVFGGRWRKVKYVNRAGTPAHASRISKYIEQRKAVIARGGFMVDVGAFADSPINLEKDDAFRDEKELRVVIEANPSWKFVKYRDTRFGITPYIELTSSTGNGDDLPRTVGDKLPIRHIRIGPFMEPTVAQRALRSFLDDSGYGHVKISRSDIPFR